MKHHKLGHEVHHGFRSTPAPHMKESRTELQTGAQSQSTIQLHQGQARQERLTEPQRSRVPKELEEDPNIIFIKK